MFLSLCNGKIFLWLIDLKGNQILDKRPAYDFQLVTL